MIPNNEAPVAAQAPLSPEEMEESALLLVAQLHTDGQLTDDERDSLKGKLN